MKKLLTNQFLWNCIMAVCGLILSCCYIWDKEYILAICWIVITICNIIMAWLYEE